MAKKNRDKEPKKQVDVGDDSVVIGDVKGSVGSRSVVVGPTDNRGNTDLSQPMAVGFGARAGKNSIAIGAYTEAGASFSADLDALRESGKAEGAEALGRLSQAVAECTDLTAEQQQDAVRLLGELAQVARSAPRDETWSEAARKHLSLLADLGGLAELVGVVSPAILAMWG